MYLYICASTWTSMCAPGVHSACMQCRGEHYQHHTTHPSVILLLVLPVPQGAVPGDKHQVPGPQSASNGSCSIINVARANKYSETQSETAVDEIKTKKFSKFVPSSVQVLSWPSSLVDTPQSLLSELEPQTSNTKPLPSPVLLP